MLTAHGSVPLAVTAMKQGAADFVLKPFDREELLFAVKKALAQARHPAASEPPPPPGRTFVGASPAMRECEAIIARAAAGRATVLLRGESGTGKELAARALHQQSDRRDGPFVKIHCAALPDNLLESELFGYEKGAFTGAIQRKPGRVDLAEGGTLFLDEIGDVTPAVQVKLLRLLQDREFERLGGVQTMRADVRFVAATHRDLEAMVARGDFREDLFYRLNVIPIWMPPLRDRPGDIEPLAERFCAELGAPSGRAGSTLEAEALALLAAQPWPGNVRQLQNFVERLIVLSEGPVISADDVRRELGRKPPALAASSTKADPGASSPNVGGRAPQHPPSENSATSLRSASLAGAPPEQVDAAAGRLDARRKQAERDALEDALRRAGGNRSLAARLLGVSRRTLYNKLEELELLEPRVR
jgi:two-component system response regulator AtoC